MGQDAEMSITTVGLDADDTLWHNETIFRLTQARFLDLLSDHDNDAIAARLAEVERRNLRLYGYGVKGFTLSMIETAMELCDGDPPPRAIREILAAGREMLAHPVETLPGVDEALAALSEKYRLVLITKGDLLDQERKLAQSGLGDLFHGVEIVSDKTAAMYQAAFARHGAGPQNAAMVGNSLKSDVLPALAVGAWGIHVPHDLTWSYEQAEPPIDEPRFRAISDLGALPILIAELKNTP